MLNIIKKAGLGILIAWAVCFVFFCIILPGFHKKSTVPEEPTDYTQFGNGVERVMCIDDNQDALIRRLQLIESAEKELILSTYYYGNDNSAMDITSALYAAAGRGVHIRIMVDGISAVTSLSGNRSFRALAALDNVEVKIYNPVNLLFPWTIHYRMHDKYIAADDSLYILGGRNTRNVSLGTYTEKRDYDRDILVYETNPGTGKSLNQVKAYFEKVWALETTKIFHNELSNPDEELILLKEHYEKLQVMYPQAFVPVSWEECTMEAADVLLITNPVQAGNKEPHLWDAMVDVVRHGRQITIQTPYLICNHTMYEDLQKMTNAGKDIRLITNAVETGANPCGCADYMNQKYIIQQAGLSVYEYAGGRSMHTKTVLMDDRISIVGSFNFDMRSAYLDTEMMLVIDCPELNEQLRSVADGYMDQSRFRMTDDSVRMGDEYPYPSMGVGRSIMLGFIRILILPLRHLL